MIKSLALALDGLKNTCTCQGKTNPFLIYFGGWLLLLLFPMLFATKYASFVEINHLRSFPADILFTFFTILGNGIILIPLTILFLVKKNYLPLIMLLVSILLTTLLSSILKHNFDHPRPLALYGREVVHTAKWITLYSKHSFPSGHTASAFCIAASLSLSFSKYKYMAIITFICAALTGYSRVYLGEHFVEDLWFGSIVGVSMSITGYMLVQYIANRIITARKKKQEVLEGSVQLDQSQDLNQESNQG